MVKSINAFSRIARRLLKENMINFKEIYEILLEEYDRQGWWPLLAQGHDGPRGLYSPEYSTRELNIKEQFEICAGAILTQNTNWSNAERALINLFNADALEPAKLADMDTAKIAELIRPSGYFNQKAKKLKAFSQFAQKKPQPDRNIFLSQWGLGPETVDDMLLYAFNIPIFVVDVYTKRLFSRLNLCDEKIAYHDLQDKIMNDLVLDVIFFKEYHALIVRHAKEHCRKNPACDGCPLSACCEYEALVKADL